MPTKKPKLQIVVDEKTYIEFKRIAMQQERSESKMGELMIKEYIQRYREKPV